MTPTPTAVTKISKHQQHSHNYCSSNKTTQDWLKTLQDHRQTLNAVLNSTMSGHVWPQQQQQQQQHQNSKKIKNNNLHVFTWSVSFENRCTILPTGVVSKKLTGACRTLLKRAPCSRRLACRLRWNAASVRRCEKIPTMAAVPVTPPR